MTTDAHTAGSSRAAILLGMAVVFLGGYLLGSMGRGSEPAKQSDPAKTPRKSVPVGMSPALGPPDALVTVVEFADFQCPFCSRSVPTRKRLFTDFGGQVRWVFKHLPLEFHPQARPAAEASLAAHAQGQFWEYHDRLFVNQGQLDQSHLLAYAEQIGLDMDRFKEALASPTPAKLVDADLELVRELKVEGTPNFFINGRHFMGLMSYSRLEEVMREEMAYARSLLRQGVSREELYHHLVQGKRQAAPPATQPATQPASLPVSG